MQKTFMKTFINAEFNDILGQDTTKEQIKSALMSNHHIIIVGPPGVGKTTLAKNIAKLLPELTVNNCAYNCNPQNPLCPACILKSPGTKKISGIQRFVRIQGSPDLTVEDLLGDIDPIKALKFGPSSIEAFTPGKIFRANQGVLFFDEVNRCPERLQNSLLQVLSEGTATLGSYKVELPADFILIATMNPEDTSTEPLSEVFLDRFDIIHMGYPETLQIEAAIVKSKGKNLDVEFPDKLLNFLIGFVQELRGDKKIEKKPSVRASIYLYERAQANCLLDGKKKVNMDHINKALVSVLSHRIKLIPSAKYLQSPEEHVHEEFRKYLDKHSEDTSGDG